MRTSFSYIERSKEATMIYRSAYMNVLKQYRGVQLVKILAGIRRSGKSTILNCLKEDLLAEGVAKDLILTHNFALMTMPSAMDAARMYEIISAQITDGDTYYLLLNEIQEVEGWEKVLNTFLERANVDIYVTGSNSKLLSSEISSYLSGRYIQIDVYPLSFSEYLLFKGTDVNQLSNKNQALLDYMQEGGFPLIAANNFSHEQTYQIVQDIYHAVVETDIVRRFKLRDTELFSRTVAFTLDNVGKVFSASSISKFLKNEGRKLSTETIYNYLNWLEKSFVIYRCKRFDLQGKEVLRTQEKFYVADSSLKFSLFGFAPTAVASMLENLCYLELRRRAYQVYVGKLGSKEIDFVADKTGKRIYVQVCRNLPEDSAREIENLTQIPDSWPKYILTLDEFATGTVDGVEIMHIADFLLDQTL